MVREMRTLWKRYADPVSELGLFQSIFYKLQKLRVRFTKVSKPFVVYSKRAQFPLRCRPKTSDLDIFAEIFASGEYRCFDDIPDAELIIDCGANAGYSSAYLLSKFPRASVIAVEPDPENFSLLQTNLAPYRGRFQAVCSAVWSHPAGLVISETSLGYGREAARTVRLPQNGEKPSITATDIGTLLTKSGFDRISILKIDIEGSELAVFSSNYERWLPRVENLVIELHDEECRSTFARAISDFGFRVSERNGLTLCTRMLS